MRVAWVGCLEGEAARFGEKDGLDDVSERDVAMVRAFVITPAEVQPQPVLRDALQRVIERFDVEPRLFTEFRKAQLGILDVPAHCEIRAIDLQDQTGLRDSLVFLPHRLGDREQVGLLTRIMTIVEKQRDDAWRGSAEKGFLCVHSSKGS